jgi:hypothetical protein
MISNCSVGLELVALRPSASVSHGPTDSLDVHMVDIIYQAKCNQFNQTLRVVMAWLRSDAMHPSPATVLQAGLVMLKQLAQNEPLQQVTISFAQRKCSFASCACYWSLQRRQSALQQTDWFQRCHTVSLALNRSYIR